MRDTHVKKSVGKRRSNTDDPHGQQKAPTARLYLYAVTNKVASQAWKENSGSQVDWGRVEMFTGDGVSVLQDAGQISFATRQSHFTPLNPT